MTRRACVVRNLLLLVAIVSTVAVVLAFGPLTLSTVFLVTGLPAVCLVVANLFVAATRRDEFPIPSSQAGLYGLRYIVGSLRATPRDLEDDEVEFSSRSAIREAPTDDVARSDPPISKGRFCWTYVALGSAIVLLGLNLGYSITVLAFPQLVERQPSTPELIFYLTCAAVETAAVLGFGLVLLAAGVIGFRNPRMIPPNWTQISEIPESAWHVVRDARRNRDR